MDKKDWASQYESGLTCAQIAERDYCHPGTVRAYLKSQGFVMKRLGPRPNPVPTERRCALCKEVRPLGSFPVTAGRPAGRDYKCCVCLPRKETRYKKSGFTWEQYREMVHRQNGRCAICGTLKNNKLVVDHCCDSKKVRGLLCARCNAAVGLLGGCAETLNKAVEYLKPNE